MAALDIERLYAISRSLFRNDRELLILTHAALAFCREGKKGRGKSETGFSTAPVTDGINDLFESTQYGSVQDYNVKRFILRWTGHSADPDLPAKLGAFVISKCLEDVRVLRRPAVAAALLWWPFVEEAKARLAEGADYDEMRAAHNRHFNDIVRGVRELTRDPEADDIYTNFFGGLRNRDIAYYLSYRYSLTRGKMLKTFISISTPEFNQRQVFEYRHVHRHNDVAPEGYHTESVRATRGILVGIHNSYYLLGSSIRRRREGTWPLYAEGVQVISMEKAQFTYDAPGLTALFFTINNEMRPMSGRSVLIPLGKHSRIGKLTYENFDLDVFDQDTWKNVVTRDLSGVKELAAKSDEILHFIDNVLNVKDAKLESLIPPQLFDKIRRPIIAAMDQAPE